MSDLFVDEDADREPTLWRHRPDRPSAPALVLRRCDLPSEHRDLWARLVDAFGADIRPESPPRWRCEAHNAWTTGDCPRCDEELIALTTGADQ